jgi:protein involved in polysaccharide export with SLBB domain
VGCAQVRLIGVLALAASLGLLGVGCSTARKTPPAADGGTRQAAPKTVVVSTAPKASSKGLSASTQPTHATAVTTSTDGWWHRTFSSKPVTATATNAPAMDPLASAQPTNATAVATAPEGWWHRMFSSQPATAPATSNVAQAAVASVVQQTNAMAMATAGEKNKNKVVRAGNHLKILILVDTKTEVELSDERVSDDGEIFLPLLKKVPVADKTIAEVAKQVALLYRKYYVNPEAYVDFLPEAEVRDAGVTTVGGTTVVSPRMRQVIVSGRVKNPGIVTLPLNEDLTVSRAVLMAGGLNTSARDRSIRLTRHDAAGKVTRQTVDLRAILEEGDVSTDVVLKAGDSIFVPESFW